MPYGSATGSGTTLAATGIATGHLWLIAVGLLVTVAGAVLIRFSFRADLGPTQ
ncbi:LPXTG cell wall anchor domain-containing protein [Nocardiopsis aegyptia]|uniref:LPXTG-motif cell wall-anchored protein n=1 Tax=Nocardiopsis aegyptia TaxID=220378 RepID=A0A7Z0EUV4_9ACTN|nr:LPXTG cell wall anchor domain-containing protein [Nocardiopsis aegyptia]NYJ37723.1 LPXTG-motif cell wall-anchored protein [Nocardiopsis aegyptia]